MKCSSKAAIPGKQRQRKGRSRRQLSADCSIAQPTPFDARAWRSFSAARFTGAARRSRILRIHDKTDTACNRQPKLAGASPHAVAAPASFRKSLRSNIGSRISSHIVKVPILNASFLNASEIFGGGFSRR